MVEILKCECGCARRWHQTFGNKTICVHELKFLGDRKIIWRYCGCMGYVQEQMKS